MFHSFLLRFVQRGNLSFSITICDEFSDPIHQSSNFVTWKTFLSIFSFFSRKKVMLFIGGICGKFLSFPIFSDKVPNKIRRSQTRSFWFYLVLRNSFIRGSKTKDFVFIMSSFFDVFYLRIIFRTISINFQLQFILFHFHFNSLFEFHSIHLK